MKSEPIFQRRVLAWNMAKDYLIQLHESDNKFPFPTSEEIEAKSKEILTFLEH